MEATESVLRAGYRLDRYELLCPIASGGMATVWLARLRGKRGFEKLFAVKTIRTELVDDERFQEMFLDEARIASGIQHPNVAQILDLGEQNDVLFIVMEWVDGDSLAKIRKLLGKRGTQLPVGIVLRVLGDACGGLHAAHELRDEDGKALEVVHRDVSPHNILLSSSGAVKVIDFGIAKAQNRRQGQTRTGIVKGKVQYMAPEQVKKGGSVDRRADVWALGVCLHELVVGRLPWDGEDEVGVIRRLMADEAPVISPEVPPAIARVLQRSMVIDPDSRFPTAAGMQRAIEGTMKELGESTSTEDVAGFLRAELPELATRRREAVGKAVEEARERGTPVTESRDEVAFAPTLVGERNHPGLPSAPSPRSGVRNDVGASGREAAGAIELTKRKGHAPAARSSEGSLVAALAQEPIRIPKRSRAWLWAILLIAMSGAGSAFLWPAAAKRLLATLGWPTPPASVPRREIAGAQMAPPVPSERALPAPPAATALVPPSVTPVAPSATAAVDIAYSVNVRAPLDTNPRTTPLRELPSPSAAAVEIHEAAAPAESAPVAPLPAPAASEDDPNNPYN